MAHLRCLPWVRRQHVARAPELQDAIRRLPDDLTVYLIPTPWLPGGRREWWVRIDRMPATGEPVTLVQTTRYPEIAQAFEVAVGMLSRRHAA
jgi:hypothetical protein